VLLARSMHEQRERCGPFFHRCFFGTGARAPNAPVVKSPPKARRLQRANGAVAGDLNGPLPVISNEAPGIVVDLLSAGC
jgi:hypothetical protein